MASQILIMPLPPGALGAYAVSAETGLLAATVTSGTDLLSFRWADPTNFAVLDFVTVSAAVSAAITTAVVTGLELVPARAFTAADTGGTTLTLTGDNTKLKTNFPTTLVTQIRVGTTGGVSAVTRTLDSQGIGQVIFGTGTAVGTTMLAQTVLFDRATNEYPFVMAQNEGFVIRLAPLDGPTTGSFVVCFSLRWLEMSKQVF